MSNKFKKAKKLDKKLNERTPLENQILYPKISTPSDDSDHESENMHKKFNQKETEENDVNNIVDIKKDLIENGMIN